jgi:hypothetical protein
MTADLFQQYVTFFTEAGFFPPAHRNAHQSS